MAVQMYLIHPKNAADDHAREVIGEFIARLQGFILMATSDGSLIVAFDEGQVAVVRAHPFVKFVGGVTLNPEGPASKHIQHLFAQNISIQLAGRRAAGGESDAASGGAKPENNPPGYRPLRWPKRE